MHQLDKAIQRTTRGISVMTNNDLLQPSAYPGNALSNKEHSVPDLPWQQEPDLRMNKRNRPTRHRALLLDSNGMDYHAMQRALGRNATPFECDHARRLGDANTRLAHGQYDIIVTTMDLPDSSGPDTISTLSNLAHNTPIVVLSDPDDDTMALEAALQAGAQDCIPRQYLNDAGLINRTLHHTMERHQLKLGLERTRDKVRFLAHHDQCTSLPNRLLFLDRIHQAVTQARQDQNTFALFFVALGRFKHVNDTIGHCAGDEVLRCVGKRMKALVGDSDTVARYGGDEFVVIVQHNGDDSVITRLAETLVDTINQPIPFGHHLCSVGASVGVACYPQHGHAAESLIKNADMAMHQAKKKGHNQVQLFTHKLFEQQRRSLNLEKALREALHDPDNNFSLHYQPRVELATGSVRSVEALIRWHHAQLGNISPDQFIPLAEELGLVEHIDQWVLATACQKARQWQMQGSDIRIGVNISGCSFNQPHFVSDIVKPLLKQYGIHGRRLEMEITERVLLVDTQQVLGHIEALKSLGIALAIDDFGTFSDS